jgi:hypothetical protein
MSNPHFDQCLLNNLILIHPFVIGELACGNLHARRRKLAEISGLPWAVCAEHDEVLALLEEHHLFGQGVNWVDAHLLASALLSHCRLWTLDVPVRAAAARLKISYSGVI